MIRVTQATLGWPRAYRTGDRVRQTDRGLVFIGRLDDQVKIGGRRIDLSEVETELTAVPGVRAGAVATQRTKAGHHVPVPRTGRARGGLQIAGVAALITMTAPGWLITVLGYGDWSGSHTLPRVAWPWLAAG